MGDITYIGKGDEMENVINLVVWAKSSDERRKIYEKFSKFQQENENEKQVMKIFQEASGYLTYGTDDEKKASLGVLSKMYHLAKIPWIEETVSEKYKKIIGETPYPVSEEEVLGLIENCMELLLSENGSVRMASVNAISHWRIYLSTFDEIELYYKLLSLKHYAGQEKEKSINLCIDRIGSNVLDRALEDSVPLETRHLKPLFTGKDKKKKEIFMNIWKIADKLIDEARKLDNDFLKFRGGIIFDRELCPYIVNLGIFQIYYEIQRLKEMAEKKKIDGNLLANYLSTRIAPFIKKHLDFWENIENKKDWEVILFKIHGKKFFLINLEELYSMFLKIFQKYDVGCPLKID